MSFSRVTSSDGAARNALGRASAAEHRSRSAAKEKAFMDSSSVSCDSALRASIAQVEVVGSHGTIPA
jgi:hypothetical protein